MIFHHEMRRCGLMLGAIFIGLSNGYSAAGVTVGDPAHPAGLAAAIQTAYAEGARDITIAPGAYDLPASNQPATLLLDGWEQAAIHLSGVTLVFVDLQHRPVLLRRCQGVTLDGGTLRFAQPAFTQGRIVTMGQDEKGSYCDWKVDAGYTRDIDPLHSDFNTVDQATRLLKVGTGDWGPTASDRSGDDVFRLHYTPSRDPHVAVGDWLVTRAKAGSSVVQLDHCEACTVTHTVLENAGFAAFFETEGAGGNHYLHCRIEPGPRPAGATEDELVGCGADGFHSTGTTTGPDIEDCVFAGVFLDDCIAIHGSFCRVLSQNGDTLTLKGAAQEFKAGEPLRIADMKGFFAEATIASIVPAGDRLWQVTLDKNIAVPIDAAEMSDEKKGTKASDPDHCGQAYKILRCRLGNTRSRGILVKADNGLIDGCTIEGAGMSAISIGPEFWWGEAGYCANVVASHNHIRGCVHNNGDQPAMWIHGDGAMGNRNITIADNVFSSCYGQTTIGADWTEGVQIMRNRIDGSFQLPLAVPGSVIAVNHCHIVVLKDNVVIHQGGSAGNLVRLGPDQSASEVKNADDSGIRLQEPSTGG